MNPHYPLLTRRVVPQALLDPEIFRADIIAQNNGCPNIRWEKAFPCPCKWVTTFGGQTGEVGGEQRPECEKCRNAGVYYVRQPDTFAQVGSAGAQVDNKGRLTGDSWQRVQANFTCLPETAPAKDDRLTLLTAWMQVSERRTRKRQVEQLRFPIEVKEVVSASPNDPYIPVCRPETIIELAWSTKVGVFVQSGVQGINFEVVDGAIDHEGGTDAGVPIGCDYVVTYHIHPRYIIQGHPFIHRPALTKFPHQVGAQETPRATEMAVLAAGYLELVGPAPGSTGV